MGRVTTWLMQIALEWIVILCMFSVYNIHTGAPENGFGLSFLFFALFLDIWHCFVNSRPSRRGGAGIPLWDGFWLDLGFWTLLLYIHWHSLLSVYPYNSQFCILHHWPRFELFVFLWKAWSAKEPFIPEESIECVLIMMMMMMVMMITTSSPWPFASRAMYVAKSLPWIS